jgi:hypothetical protein
MADNVPSLQDGVGLLNEKPLHAALKAWYARPGDRTEAPIDGSFIDIVRDGLLIEIQTRGFSALKRKLEKLVIGHPVRLVYPIPDEKWILRLADDGVTPAGRRKSPKRGSTVDLFRELVSFPHLVAHPNFSLEVLLIQEEEVRRYDPRLNWRRRGWGTAERRLLQVVDDRLFTTPADLAALIPESLNATFTTAELAEAVGRPRRLAQQMAYCLRCMGVLSEAGKQGRAIQYVRIR